MDYVVIFDVATKVRPWLLFLTMSGAMVISVFFLVYHLEHGRVPELVREAPRWKLAIVTAVSRWARSSGNTSIVAAPSSRPRPRLV